MRRSTLIAFLAMLLLWALVTQLNHYLAGWHVYLFVGGLFGTYAALHLPFRSGFFATAATGLLCDATGAAPMGTHLLLLLGAHSLLFRMRDRLPRDETAGRVVIALLVNLALFLALSFLLIGRNPQPGAAWSRLGVDLVCSQALIILIGPWFFALQERALELAGFTQRRLL